MSKPEVILLAGAPGAGKSSIGEKFEEIGKPAGTRHLEIGKLKRGIEAGLIPSAWAEMLKKKEHSDRITGAAPSEAMIGIMEEFILKRPDCLTVIDGFPRYMDRLAPFKESMHKIGANVLALAIVEVTDTISLERLNTREARPQQKLKDPVERLHDHRQNIVPTLEALADDLPTYTLDGTQSFEFNAAVLLNIYQMHREN